MTAAAARWSGTTGSARPPCRGTGLKGDKTLATVSPILRESDTAFLHAPRDAGEMAERIRAFNWAATPLGAIAAWPQSLRSTLSICLGSSFPMAIYWGPELRLLYNDAWAPIPADRHPWALGRPGAEVWADIWDVVGPELEGVLASGEGFSAFDQLLRMERDGVPRETYWNYSFTPIRGEDGRVVGVLNMGNEVTDKVVAERRSTLLLALADRLRDLDAPDEIALAAASLTGEHLGVDRVGFADIDADGRTAVNHPDWTAAGAASLAGPHRFETFGPAFAAALRAGEAILVDDVRADERTAPVAAAFADLGVRALAVTPVNKGGRLVAALFAHAAAPRRWSGADARLLEEVAERGSGAMERARARAAQANSERRLRLVLDSVSDGFYALDPEWRFTLFNAACERYFDRKREEVVGRTLWDVFPEARGTLFEERYRAVMRDRQPITFEADSVSRPDRAVEMRAAPKAGGGMAVSFSDITERRRQSEAVEASKRLLDAVVDAMPVGVVIADAKGAITRTNPANELLWGTTPETRSIGEYAEWVGYWPDTGRRVESGEWVLARAITSGETCEGELVEIERFGDGGRRFIINSGAPVRDEAGKVVAGLVAQLDVTERVEAERALAQALHTKDVLLHEVNHRVKNSLQIVTSLLMLQIGQTRDPALRQALTEARGRIAVVAAMHQRLYSTSEHDRVDFGDYVREMATETLRSLDVAGRIRLDVDVEEGIVILLTQAVPLALVVSELVTNAVKYAYPDDRGGELRVAVRRDEGDDPNDVRIEVVDDGVGLPDGFDPARSGGLGMRIVTALVRQVRGRLDIDRENAGTGFRVHLNLTTAGQ